MVNRVQGNTCNIERSAVSTKASRSQLPRDRCECSDYILTQPLALSRTVNGNNSLALTK